MKEQMNLETNFSINEMVFIDVLQTSN